MARIFRTEKLSLNGDNIRIRSQGNGEFEITDSDNNVLISRATIESDISSLATQSSLESGRRDSDVSSLAASIGTNDSDLSSLAATDVTHTSDISSLAKSASGSTEALDSDVSSLATLSSLTRKETDSDVSSLAALIVTNDVLATGVALQTNDLHKVVSFGITYPSTPAVVGTLMSAGANDPIIGVQLSGISTTQATFVFSDEIPNNDYTLEVLVSI